MNESERNTIKFKKEAIRLILKKLGIIKRLFYYKDWDFFVRNENEDEVFESDFFNKRMEHLIMNLYIQRRFGRGYVHQIWLIRKQAGRGIDKRNVGKIIENRGHIKIKNFSIEKNDETKIILDLTYNFEDYIASPTKTRIEINI